MPVIHLETLIIAPVERCFDLSRSIDLHTISTDQTKEKAIAGKTSGMISLGETVTWSAIHFGIRQEMESKITEYNYPVFFVDEMQRGAFRSIYHEHHFKAVGGNTLMTDIFRFKSPLGILGRLADRFLLYSHLRTLLEKRNATIKHYAESDMWKDIL